MIQIKNEVLSAGVQKKGAELCSLKNLKTGTEYIWQADPKIWPSHAPNLFPVIGILKSGSYYFEGEKYQLPKHGFVRHNENVKLVNQDETRLTFELNYSEETLKSYPFKFKFEINFTLKANTLQVSHRIFNLDEKPLYFSLGGHPAFNTPLSNGQKYEDYYLQFDQKQDLNSYVLNEDGLVKNETKVITKDDNRIQLNKNIFDDDALIFKNIKSKKVSLNNRKSGRILTVAYEDFENLGVWAKPGAPYVCIEPWLGIADVEETSQDIKIKEGIMKLMPSKTFNASYTISIE